MNGDIDIQQMNFMPHYRARYGANGSTYEEYEFAYRFGYDLALNPDFEDEVWVVIEMNARKIWKQTYPTKNWFEYRDGVRFAWQIVKQAVAKAANSPA